VYAGISAGACEFSKIGPKMAFKAARFTTFGSLSAMAMVGRFIGNELPRRKQRGITKK
jgi:hypothetical protein